LNFIDFSPPAHCPKRSVVVRQGQVAPWGKHDIEIQISSEVTIEINRSVIKTNAFWREIVRTKNRRVSTRSPTADVGTINHGNILNAMVLR
jgi:hypothetical protein